MFKTLFMAKPDDYNKTAKIYNNRYRETQFEKYRIMLSGLKLNGQILDHGCGTGLLGEFLASWGSEAGEVGKRAWLLHGCDSSKEMLKIRGAGDLCKVEKLPYKNTEFDFVLSFSMLMNCKNPEKVIKEIKRVLKLNGTFVCTFLKSFESKLKPLLEKHFKIQLETNCGEDVGFLFRL